MMQITIKYFGLTIDCTSRSEEQLSFTGNLSDLKQYLIIKYPLLGQAIFQVAVNQVITNDSKIEDGDEVVLLPQYSGG
ncbi:MAG: MoaD/ThiS family protein [Cyclobacteriaceae bacterium]|nr:MoaD/ThiS family protein [Cyclobacteriaceae bacterium HetDA_MAG_MS6]